MSPGPGEVWLADLGLAAKTRPVVIVSRRDPDSPRALVLYVPLTTQSRPSSYEVPIPRLPFLDRESFAKVQGMGSIPNIRLERQIGRIPEQAMARSEDPSRTPLIWVRRPPDVLYRAVQTRFERHARRLCTRTQPCFELTRQIDPDRYRASFSWVTNGSCDSA